MISGRVPQPIMTLVRPSFFHLKLCSISFLRQPLPDVAQGGDGIDGLLQI